MPSPVPRRRLLAVFGITILVVLLGSLILALRDPSPRHGGKSLREWVEILGTPTYEKPLVEERIAARQAVLHIGTNAIPFLIQWIGFDPHPSAVGARIAKITLKIPGGKHLQFLGMAKIRPIDEVRARGAKEAFIVLGSQAQAGIPQLALLVETHRNARLQDRAVDALAAMGPAALPALMTLLTNKTDSVGKLYALYAIGRLGTNAAPAIPLLLNCLNDSPGWEATTADYVLRELKLKTYPDILVPALSALKPTPIKNHFLINALGDLGYRARPALPYLLAALTNSNAITRHYATNALLNVAPELLTNSPAL